MINQLYEILPVEIVFQILRWSPHPNVEIITDYWNRKNHMNKTLGHGGVLEQLKICINKWTRENDNGNYNEGQDSFHCYYSLSTDYMGWEICDCNLERWSNLRTEFGLTEYHQILYYIGYD